MLYDGYGDDERVPEDQFLADCEGWLARTARDLTRSRPERFDDVRQEGMIVLWRKFREHADLPLAEQVANSMAPARSRMKEVAWREARLTGMASRQGHALIPETSSLDDEDFYEAAFLSVETLEGLELAYHRGEIMEALESLTEKQRKYIYARFWCGMDPAGGLHSNPGMKEARTNNPYLRRDILWTGSKATPGAKKKLAEALAHLSGL